MALLAYALTTVSRVTSYIGISAPTAAQQAQIEALINVATHFIQNYAGRHFQQQAYSNELIDGSSTDALLLKNFPVSSSASFSLSQRNTDLNSDDWSVLDTDLYFIDYDQGAIYGAGRTPFALGRYTFRASYTAGFNFDNVTTFLQDTTAGDIELAMWIITSTLFRNAGSNTAVKSETLSKYSVSYGVGINAFLSGLGLNKSDVDIVTSILQHYRRGSDLVTGVMSPLNY